jgi:DNA repair exonuclease SbcCD ATPase subunit
MNTKTYNNENLIAYLLGALPDAEAEIFDELSFTDDSFAGELSAAEKDLVDAYVTGELTGEKLEKFESHYLATPRRREKVEFAKAFQGFAEKNLTVIESIPKRTLGGFFSDIFVIRRPLLQWGFALAALLFMILGGWLFRENARLNSEISESQAKRDELRKRESELEQREKQLQGEIANQRTTNSETEKELAKIREEREKLEQELKIRQSQEQQRINEQRADAKKTPASLPNTRITVASFILTPSLRGNSQLTSVSIPPQTDSVAMQLELETNDYTAYRVVLKNQSGDQILWRSGRLKAKTKGTNKILNVVFPARLLRSQAYTLEVSGVSSNATAEIISSYSFRVVP